MSEGSATSVATGTLGHTVMNRMVVNVQRVIIVKGFVAQPTHGPELMLLPDVQLQLLSLIGIGLEADQTTGQGRMRFFEMQSQR